MNKMPVFLIRGIPGAGKSTFAKALKTALDNAGEWNPAGIFETDNFFVDSKTGEYKFDVNLLALAHNWNQAEVYRFCRDNDNAPCIIANSFTTFSEIKPYQGIAGEFNRRYYIISIKTIHKNVHGVPDHILYQMKNRWMKCRNEFEVRSDKAVPEIVNAIVRSLRSH